jgi:hypothetical protein
MTPWILVVSKYRSGETRCFYLQRVIFMVTAVETLNLKERKHVYGC